MAICVPRCRPRSQIVCGTKALATETNTARKEQTIAGVGPMTALAVEAFAPSRGSFGCARALAAWLGLVYVCPHWTVKSAVVALQMRPSRHTPVADRSRISGD